MRLILSFAALFLSVILLQLSSGGVGPLDALTGLEQGFTKGQIGILGSSHFLGFFIGCWWAPRVMGSVGHSRAFAVFTAMGAIGMLGHTLLIDPTAWAVMRVASGLCVAGCYTVGWLWSGQAARASPPITKAAPRLRPLLALSRSPLAVFAVMVSGLTSAAYRMVGPIYGTELNLNASQIGLFLAGYVLGGAISQYPAGWLADKFDRRWVVIGISIASLISCTLSFFALGVTQVIIASCLFGFITVPIYSVATAHAHDFASTDERVELSAALLFYYAIGAIASPIVAALLIETFGTGSFFIFIAIAHLLLAAIGGLRLLLGDTALSKTPYIYAPRTSFMLGRLTKILRDPGSSSKP